VIRRAAKQANDRAALGSGPLDRAKLVRPGTALVEFFQVWKASVHTSVTEKPVRPVPWRCKRFRGPAGGPTRQRRGTLLEREFDAQLTEPQADGGSQTAPACSGRLLEPIRSKRTDNRARRVSSRASMADQQGPGRFIAQILG